MVLLSNVPFKREKSAKLCPADLQLEFNRALKTPGGF